MSYGLRTIKTKEHRPLFRFTEEDKFLFGCLDAVVSELQRNFPDYSKEFFINALKMNTMNIANVYEFLTKPSSHRGGKEFNIAYNSIDDHVIQHMKESNFYKELVELRGREDVERREFFIN